MKALKAFYLNFFFSPGIGTGRVKMFDLFLNAPLNIQYFPPEAD